MVSGLESELLPEISFNLNDLCMDGQTSNNQTSVLVSVNHLLPF